MEETTWAARLVGVDGGWVSGKEGVVTVEVLETAELLPALSKAITWYE